MEFSESYEVTAEAGKEHSWETSSGESFETGWTTEFGGSFEGPAPENYLAVAMGNCFVATFEAMAERSGFEFESISVEGELFLEPDGSGGSELTRFEMKVTLRTDEDEKRAMTLLERVEPHCFIMDAVDLEKQIEFELP
jgi:organic hydroperoxide reductase OsmC/OhrA